MRKFEKPAIAEVLVVAEVRSSLQQLEVDVFAAHLAAREQLAAQKYGFMIAAVSPMQHAVETAVGDCFTSTE